jgi:diaminopimelate decarboxylase
MILKDDIFLFGEIPLLDLAKKYGTPLYLYDEDIIRNKVKSLYDSVDYKKFRIYYSCKANSNLEIMKVIKDEGAFLDCVSTEEIRLGLLAGYDTKDILFTGNNSTQQELEFCIENQITVNVDSLSQLERYGKLNSGGEVFVRINPDVGLGHHHHVITGGDHSKFGIYYDKVDQIKKLAKEYNLKIKGIHTHVGSGILEADMFPIIMDIVFSYAKKFDDLDVIDFGGGLGIPYEPKEKSIDIIDFGKRISEKFRKFTAEYGKELSMYVEPGRFIVAESGILLIQVNTLKTTPAFKFVGTNSGFNHLIRPMAYGSYHSIINCSNPLGDIERVVIAGNLCESGDVFTLKGEEIEERELPEINEGDILAILDTGAYGYSMSSNYNMRLRPCEIMIKNGESRIIRRKETFEDLISTQYDID